MIRMTSFLTAALAILAFATSPALGAIVCVEPTGADGCLTTLAAGVAAAGAGDTVELRTGKYFENVTIPAGKNGLHLIGAGSGATILDAGPPNTGVGLTITSSSVVVEGLTIRNSNVSNIQVTAAITGTTFRKIVSAGAGDDCINLGAGANTALVESSTLSGCDEQALDANGGTDSITVRKSIINKCSAGCIRITGATATIDSNKIDVADDGDCIKITGATATVTANSLRNCEDSGVEIDGTNPSVIDNTLSVSAGDGYDINCTTCSGGSVSANSATRISNNEGFAVSSDAVGLVVEDNTVTLAGGRGFQISGTGITVRSNTAKDCNQAINSSVFDVSGSGHSVEENTADGSRGDGFRIAGSGHTFTANTAENNGRDGFDILNGAASITLSGNLAKNNDAEGIDVSLGTASVTLTGNTATGNRTQMCNSAGAVITDGGGNSFDIGTAPACVLD